MVYVHVLHIMHEFNARDRAIAIAAARARATALRACRAVARKMTGLWLLVVSVVHCLWSPHVSAASGTTTGAGSGGTFSVGTDQLRFDVTNASQA
eukprot:COSAG02_NODE_16062_length_1116_cov_1.726647_2_plen_94_part_01